MKKLLMLAALAVSCGTLLSACGESEPVSKDELAAKMDQVCRDLTPQFNDLGTRGLAMTGLALEFDGEAEMRQKTADELAEINAVDQARTLLDRYVKASEAIVKQDRAVAKAAKDNDEIALAAAFAAQSEAFKKREVIAKQIGLEVCGQPIDIEAEGSGTKPPDDLNAVKPRNTVKDFAKKYVKDAISGDCKAINENRHTDAGSKTPEECEVISTTLANGFVAATESYGPVAQAEIVGKGEARLATYFVTDLDGNLRWGGDAIHDRGGLRPAPEDNDARDSVDGLVKAIRDGDVDAFNRLLAGEDSPFFVKGKDLEGFVASDFTKPFLADIRDSDQEPTQLGLNAAFGFYFMEGSKYDWVITMIHNPGSGGHYRFAGFYPVPKP